MADLTFRVAEMAALLTHAQQQLAGRYAHGSAHAEELARLEQQARTASVLCGTERTSGKARRAPVRPPAPALTCAGLRPIGAGPHSCAWQLRTERAVRAGLENATKARAQPRRLRSTAPPAETSFR